MTTLLAETAMVEQYKDLIFALHDCWGVVHARADEGTKAMCLQLLRENGEFADPAPEPSIEMNARLYHALELARPAVDDSWTSQTLRSTLGRVLEKHRPLSHSAYENERVPQEADDSPSP